MLFEYILYLLYYTILYYSYLHLFIRRRYQRRYRHLLSLFLSSFIAAKAKQRRELSALLILLGSAWRAQLAIHSSPTISSHYRTILPKVHQLCALDAGRPVTVRCECNSSHASLALGFAATLSSHSPPSYLLPSPTQSPQRLAPSGSRPLAHTMVSFLTALFRPVCFCLAT